jgi:UDP-N-acetylmuramoyl-tripeptide--D-alanyl-D-alanine ligase
MTGPMRQSPLLSDRPRGAERVDHFDAPSLAQAVDGRLMRAGAVQPIHGGAVDSRRVEPGYAFFAFPGEHTDGHRFLVDAAERGAAALIVTREVPSDELMHLDGMPDGGPAVIAVDDALTALHSAAREWRSRFDPIVVGVTGSLAKTSTKEQIAEVLAARWNVLRNNANENNEIGLPLTLLRLRPEHEVAVLEMGMYEPGDIAVLAALARPKIGVVTAVRGTHIARAGSIDEIERGKRELVEALRAGGTAVLNADDARVAAMARSVPAGVSVVTYGFDPAADVTATNVESRGVDGMRFRLHAGDRDADAETPALGRHSVHNALAAAAVAMVAGMSLAEIAAALTQPLQLPHRTTLVEAGDWRLLDDSYNAAPDSMFAALDLLASLPGRRVAVLGEMLELGDGTAEAHRRVGEHAAASADVLLAVGPESPTYVAAALAARSRVAASNVYEARDRDEALSVLLDILRPGDVVLFKASRGAELDLLFEAVRARASDRTKAEALR